ncbi:MAG: hypothetical protein JWR85_4152 [Marmoricola sp.]|nr:hypothetical protein [Marmoricola sp.]
MSRAGRDDRVSRLAAAAKVKSETAHSKARRAILALENRGLTVNFRTVADEAGVSRDFLYRSPEIRQLISDRRRRPPAVLNPSPQATRNSEASATVKLAVATAALQRLREENRRLREENARLLGDLRSERRRGGNV